MNSINLLPDPIKERRKNSLRDLRFYSILMAITFLFVAGFIVLEAASQILVFTAKSDREQIASTEKEIAEQKQIEDNAAKINEIVANLEELQKDQTLWSMILTELAYSTPSSIQINALTADNKTKPNFKISGSATAFSDIIKFKDKLEDSKYFKDVLFESSEKSDKESKITFTYALTLNLEQKR